MAGEQQQRAHPTVAPHAGHEQRMCPACGRHVETVLGRRKSLGIFVPVWSRGPCRNPDCRDFTEPDGR